MPSTLQSALQRDRAIVVAALGVITAMAWGWTAYRAWDMSWMSMGADWSAGYFAATFVMWTVMMIGMMIPSAAPAILLVSALDRTAAVARASLFAAGYLACWTAFSLTATLAQWGMVRSGLLDSPMLIRATPSIAAALFIAAGVYQVTPWKRACLRHCQMPAAFLARHWRPGRAGAFRTGFAHGAFCTGCCWVLMLLLFALGVMNLLWVAALAAFVLAEKLLAGALVRRAGALAMLGAGLVLLWMRPGM